MSTNQQSAGDAPSDARRILSTFADEVFGKKDLSNVERFMRSDYIQHNPLVAQGSDGFRQFFSDWFKASPDFKYELKQLAVDGDRIWAHGVYSGTHSKEWLGIPQTNRAYAFDAVDIFRIQDGKLAEHWDVMDVHGLFRQLGVLS